MARGNKILHQLRKLPESQKKIIVWALTILIGIGMLVWLAPRLNERMRASIQGPGILEGLPLPEVKIPSFDTSVSEKELRALEEQLNSLQETGSSSKEHTDGEQ